MSRTLNAYASQRYCCMVVASRRYASHAHHPPADTNVERQSDLYRPGSDSYAYENPWPKLNKGRLDWLFQDGWRRPLAQDQGAKMRRQWIWWGQMPYDEHKDWYRFHRNSFAFYGIFVLLPTFLAMFFFSDTPKNREWALREAHFEIERREKAGLPYISKDLIDPQRVLPTLPTDEELRDFEIVI